MHTLLELVEVDGQPLLSTGDPGDSPEAYEVSLFYPQFLELIESAEVGLLSKRPQELPVRDPRVTG
jgi:hypothetical protein